MPWQACPEASTRAAAGSCFYQEAGKSEPVTECSTVEHAYHVPRDVDAGLSVQAREIKHDAPVRLHIFDVTAGVARVVLVPTTA